MALPFRSRITLSKNFSIVSTENIPLAAQTEAAEPVNYPLVTSLTLSLFPLPLSLPLSLSISLFIISPFFLLPPSHFSLPFLLGISRFTVTIPPPNHTCSEGYIQGRLQEDRVLIYMGIIDILQSYRLKKKLEHTMKSVITDGVSCIIYFVQHHVPMYAKD